MQINAALNLVFPVRITDPDEKGNTTTLVWAYHTPISPEIFETYYRIIAAARNELFQGPNLEARWRRAAEDAPVIGRNVLLDAATRDAERYDGANLGPTFLAELDRLTTILAPGEQGFQTTPFSTALERNMISSAEAKEVQSVLVFFTCGYVMTKASSKEWAANLSARLLMGSITSSSATEFLASLAISTPAENSTAEQSSVPS